MWAKGNTFTLLGAGGRLQTVVATMESSENIPQKARNKSNTQSSYTTLGHVSKRKSFCIF